MKYVLSRHRRPSRDPVTLADCAVLIAVLLALAWSGLA